jgi:hypothetical protein
MVYRLGTDSKYGKAEIFTKDDLLRSSFFTELEIELREIFPEI